jgi:hypothetical protein
MSKNDKTPITLALESVVPNTRWPGVSNSLFQYEADQGREEITVIQWELLALVRTVQHFHKYLYGREFHLHKDHSALTRLMSFKNLKGQTACWIHRPPQE